MTASRQPGSVSDAPVTTEWHGWGWTDNRHPNLHIGPLPGRRQIALTLQDTDPVMNVTNVRVLAYFKTKRDAYAAMAAIDLLTGRRR